MIKFIYYVFEGVIKIKGDCKMNVKVRQSHTWLALGILMILLYIGCFWNSNVVNQSEAYADGLIYIEYLNSSMQRVVKLEMIGSPNEELVYHLDNIIEELEVSDICGDLMFDNEEKIALMVEEIHADWAEIQEEIIIVREGGDTDALLFASERLYYTTTELALTMTDNFTQISGQIIGVQILLMVLVGMISLIIFRHLYMSFLAIKHARELTERMFIDVSTGLYNRSKCQEMLKDTLTPATSKSRIMVVVDLNDLKITNDKLGHQVGDELIASFASILRKAIEIHEFDVFAGRYGGDEFMIYYQSAEEMDVKLYLEELKFLVDKFNNKESRFQISYAVGYAIFGKGEDALTLKDLFNKADEAMYTNKIQMKAARKALEVSEVKVEGGAEDEA